MKKLLTLLGAIGLTATTTTSVVACGNSKQLQPIDTTEFEKLAITEAQGKYFTIEQAVEGINKINNLPEGVESINVSILESPTIQVEFIAQKGYETPKPFTVNFKAKQQTGKSKINLYEIEQAVKDRNIQNLSSLKTVNRELSEVEIDGVILLNAELKQGTKTDVTVNITINEETHVLVGENSFDILGAVKYSTLTQQPTIYIDANGKEVSTDAKDISNIDTPKIIQIGFYENKDGQVQVVRMPKTIIEVPSQLPSEITSLKNIFFSCKNFNQDLSNWDVSNVTNMHAVFDSAENFNQDLSKWDVSSVTNMQSMFGYTKVFNQDLSNWDVSNVTSMSTMFYHAESFNSNISSWDVSSVTDMYAMFFSSRKFNQDLSTWDVSNVTTSSSNFNKYANSEWVANTAYHPKFKY